MIIVPKTVHGHRVLGHEILSTDGNIWKVKLWIEGWWPNLELVGDVSEVEGYSGKETELTTQIITSVIVSPVHSFVVSSNDRIAAD